MATLAELEARLEALRRIRSSGVAGLRHGDSGTEFRSDAELAAAIADLEGQIAQEAAQAAGARRIRTVRLHTPGRLVMSGGARFRIKGSSVYVEPVTARASDARLRARADSTYQTVGSGGRSIRWRSAPIGPNAALDYALTTLRAQSRELVRKNALGAAAVERIVANTIGTGIRPKAPDEATQKLWLKWTDESAADGQLDHYGQQAQIMRGVVAAGECFCRFRVRRPQDGLSVPLQLEVLEAEFVPAEKNELLASGNIVRQGVEFDRNVRSRRVAYWVYPRHPADSDPAADATNEPVRVPASEILHVFWQDRPGQVRGEPWLTRALARLKDVEEYDGAELVRKKASAMFVAFIRKLTGESVSLEDLKQEWGDDEAEESGGVGQVSLEPGTMQFLRPGEEVTFSDPKDVGGQYQIFMREQHRKIAAAIGVLYEMLTGDYSQVNDRTWRAAVSEFRRRCETWQHHMVVFQFCRPVWRRFAELAVLAGVASRALDPAEPVAWTPQAWAYINPVQDIEAAEKEIQAGLKSRTRAASERGEDAATIDAEQAADNERADALKLKHTSDGRNAAKPASPMIGHNGGPPLDDDEPVEPEPPPAPAHEV